MLTRTPRGSPNKNHLLARGIMLWRCIADDFEQMILVGKYDNAERLPAESEIAARYGVNRHTVRRAMSELAVRGLVRSLDGNFGFEPRNAMLVETNLSMAGYSGDGVPAMQKRMKDAVGTIPGVKSVGLVDNPP